MSAVKERLMQQMLAESEPPKLEAVPAAMREVFYRSQRLPVGEGNPEMEAHFVEATHRVIDALSDLSLRELGERTFLALGPFWGDDGPTGLPPFHTLPPVRKAAYEAAFRFLAMALLSIDEEEPFNLTNEVAAMEGWAILMAQKEQS